MNRLDYGRLALIAKQLKPFRGTDNHFPIAMRTHTYKRFSVETDDRGNEEYHVYYGYSWYEVEVSAEEMAKRGNKWHGRTVTEANGTKKHYEYAREWNEIGIVRNDNTLELTANSLHQGTRYFLSNMFNRYGSDVVSSVRHGGVIYREFQGNYREGYTNTKIIPLFRGQRINLDTAMSVLDYEVRTQRVNRTRSKEVLAEYDESLKLNEILFKTMSRGVFEDSLKEVFDEAMPNLEDSRYWRSASAARKMMDYATAQVKTDIFKAVCATMMGEGIYQSWTIGTNSGYWSKDSYEPEDYYRLAKQKIVRHILQGSGALDVKLYKPNEPYPSSNWDVRVMLNNNLVRTY